MERLYKERYGGNGNDVRRCTKSSAMEGKNLHRRPHINGNKARKEKEAECLTFGSKTTSSNKKWYFCIFVF